MFQPQLSPKSVNLLLRFIWAKITGIDQFQPVHWLKLFMWMHVIGAILCKKVGSVPESSEFGSLNSMGISLSAAEWDSQRQLHIYQQPCSPALFYLHVTMALLFHP